MINRQGGRGTGGSKSKPSRIEMETAAEYKRSPMVGKPFCAARWSTPASAASGTSLFYIFSSLRERAFLLIVLDVDSCEDYEAP